MKNKLVKNIILSIFLIFVSILSSCRENIIPPGNAVTNINEPVQFRTRTSYTFLINADNVSESIKDFPSLNSTYIRLFTSMLDVSSGSVQIILSDVNNQIWYSDSFDRDVKNHSIELRGGSPDLIQIRMSNFTGKLKIQLTSLR